jgi:hypothetical protein
MNDTTPLAKPTAHEALPLRMGFSPRAKVALSFLHSLEWLRTKLHAVLSRSIPVPARSLASPDYARRQIS